MPKKTFSLYGIKINLNDYKKRYLKENVPFIRNYYKKLNIPFDYEASTEVKGENWDTRKIYPQSIPDFKHKFFFSRKPTELEGVWELPGFAKIGLVKESNFYQSYIMTFNKKIKISQMSFGKLFSSLFTDHGDLDYSIFNGTKNGRFFKTEDDHILKFSGIMPNISWKDTSEKLPINFIVDYNVEIVGPRVIKGSIPGMEQYEAHQPITYYKEWPVAEQTFKKVRKDHPGYTIDSDKKDNEKKKENIKNKENIKDKENPGVGTGFFISDKGHIVTNYHVVGESKNISVQHDGTEYKSNVLAVDQRLDLALIKINIQNKKFIKFAKKSPFKSQEILVAGFPFGKAISDDLKITGGIINSLKGAGNDTTRMQIDASINPGNSGGPIVEKLNKNLIGVAVASLNKDFTKAAFGVASENTNYAIKASQVRDFLESNNIKIKSSSTKSNIKDVENSTVFIIKY